MFISQWLKLSCQLVADRCGLVGPCVSYLHSMHTHLSGFHSQFLCPITGQWPNFWVPVRAVRGGLMCFCARASGQTYTDSQWLLSPWLSFLASLRANLGS
jgi:hypothetical protein